MNPDETSVRSTANSTPPPSPVIEKPGTEVGSVFVSNYPPFSQWSEEQRPEFEAVLGQAPASPVDLGLYLHIPFCRKRCKFCYFRVYTDKNASEIQRYLDALAREVELYSEQPVIGDRSLRFVYFGGGTPSYVAVKHLRGLIERTQRVLPWDDVEEVTFECEPGTLTESKVAAYRELGVTRLSLGVEHFDDTILRENGRAHLSAEIYRAMPWIKAQDFDQLNIDLIAGMVGETWETWRTAVERTLELDPDSVTIYQMELPFNTVYSQGILSGGNSPVADWETKRAWNDYAIETLCSQGYELSSAYTLVKTSSKSRFVYRNALWHGVDMLGTGVASFGHLQGVHGQNLSGWTPYLEALEGGRLPLQRAFKTSASERMTRELILQLKLGHLSFAPFRKKFGEDPLAAYRETFERLQSEGMLRLLGEEGVELTRTGLLQVDRLLHEFYDDRYRNTRYT